MSQGCALLILRSKGQRSRSWRMVIWKWFPDDNWLCNQPMIMKLHTLTPRESRMCPIDFGVKRSTVKVMAHGYLKMVHRNNGCRFEFVGVGGGPVLLQQYFQYALICCPYMLPLLFENGFRTITDSVINQWSWNFIHLLTMSQGCALLILRSKGQRSRSWRMVIWKWFPDDNWLCNQPMIMKLHTLTPHEFVGVGGGPVLLQQYFQYAFICCPYMLPLLFTIPFGFSLFWHFCDISFQLFSYFVWLRITDDGSVLEMRIIMVHIIKSLFIL